MAQVEATVLEMVVVVGIAMGEKAGTAAPILLAKGQLSFEAVSVGGDGAEPEKGWREAAGDTRLPLALGRCNRLSGPMPLLPCPLLPQPAPRP